MAKKQEMLIEQRLKEALVLYEKTPYNLPSNWCWTRLGTVCKLDNGEKSDKEEWFYLDAKTLRTQNYERTKKDGVIVKEGQRVILVDGENSGEVFYITKRGYMGSTFKILDINKALNETYVSYFISSHQDELRNNKVGSAIPHLNKELFFNLLFPLAPLEEQKRIVDIIEKQFAKLDEAKDLIQKSLDSFADRKSAILHKAFTGELTKSWREERHRNVTKQEVCMGDVAEINPKSEKIVCSDEDDVSFIPMKAVCEIKGEIKEVLFEKFKKVKKGFTFFKEDDVLFAKITPCMENGKCFIAKGLKNKFGYASTEFYVFRCGKSIDKKYLWYILRDQAFRNRAKQVMTGAVGQQRVPKAYLEKEKIALFDLDEQEEIVRILDSIFEKEDKSKELIDMLDKIDEMKKSILARAFRGELGTSNIADEPAIELLKIILENKKGLKLQKEN